MVNNDNNNYKHVYNTPGHNNLTVGKCNNLSKPQYFHQKCRVNNTHCVLPLKAVLRSWTEC